MNHNWNKIKNDNEDSTWNEKYKDGIKTVMEIETVMKTTHTNLIFAQR